MLSNKAKRELKINQRRILIDSIEIAIPSPQQILNWGERELPNGKKVGEVKNSKTVNYKKFTPLRDGLFCERIFGPITSFVCACGKRQSSSDVTFCDKCEVEYIDKRVRRSRLGYISLVSPVVHVWYLKGRPSYLSLFLGKRKKQMLALAYCNAYLVEQAFSSIDQSMQVSPKQTFKKYQNNKQTPSLLLPNLQKQRKTLSRLNDSAHHMQSLSKIKQFSNKFHKAKRITCNPLLFKQENQVNSATVLNVLKSQDSGFIPSLSTKSKDSNSNSSVSYLEKDLQTNKTLLNPDNKTVVSALPPGILSNPLGILSNPSVAPAASTHMVQPKLSFAELYREKLPLTAQLRANKLDQSNLSNLSSTKGLLGFFSHIFVDILNQTKNNRVLSNYAHTLPSLFVTKSKNKELYLLDFYLRRPTDIFRKGKEVENFFKNQTCNIVKKYETTIQKVKNVNNFTKQKVTVTENQKQSTLLKGFSLPISGNSGYTSSKSKLITKEYSLNFSLPSYLWYQKRYLSVVGAPDSPVQPAGEAKSQSDLKYLLTPVLPPTAVPFDSPPPNRAKGLKAEKSDICFFLQSQTPQKQLKVYNRAQSVPFLPSLICKYNVREELVTFFNSYPVESDMPIPLYCEITRWEALYDVHKFMAEQSLSSSTNNLSSRSSDDNLFSDKQSVSKIQSLNSRKIKSTSLQQNLNLKKLSRSYFNNNKPLIGTRFPTKATKLLELDSINFSSAKLAETDTSISSKLNFKKISENVINYVHPDNEKWKPSVINSIPIANSIQALQTSYFESNLSSLNALSKRSQSSYKITTFYEDTISENQFTPVAKAKLLQKLNSHLLPPFSHQKASLESYSDFINTKQFKGFNKAKAKTKRVFTLGELLNLSCHFAWQKFNFTLSNNSAEVNQNEKTKKVSRPLGSTKSKIFKNLNFSILLITQVANRVPKLFKNKSRLSSNGKAAFAGRHVPIRGFSNPDSSASKGLPAQLSSIFVKNSSQATVINGFGLHKDTEISSELLTTLSITCRDFNLASIYSRLYYLLFTFEKRLLHNVYTSFLQKAIKQISFDPPVYRNYVSVNTHETNDLFFGKKSLKNSQNHGQHETPLSLFLILPKLQAITSSNANNVVSLAVQKFNPIFENFCQQKIDTFSTPSDTWSKSETFAKGMRPSQEKTQNSNLYMFLETRSMNFDFNADRLATERSTGTLLKDNEKEKSFITNQEFVNEDSRRGLLRQKKAKLSFNYSKALTKNSLNVCNIQIQPVNFSAADTQENEIDGYLFQKGAKLRESKQSIHFEEGIQKDDTNLWEKGGAVSRNKTSQFVLSRNLLFATLVANKTNQANTLLDYTASKEKSFDETQTDLNSTLNMPNKSDFNNYFEGYIADSKEGLVSNLNLDKEFFLASQMETMEGFSFQEKYLNSQNSNNGNTFADSIRYQSYSKRYNSHNSKHNALLNNSENLQIPKQSFGVQDYTAGKQTEMLSHLELNTIREILAYTGGGALEAYLKRINVISFFNFLSADITATRLTYKDKLAKIGYGNQVNRKQKRVLTRLARRISINSRRLKIIQLFMRNKRRPEWMMISVLPVLPPDLRPILQMSESVVVASDINNLYQRVIYRNNRFYKLGFIDSHLVTAIQRLVQDAVDRLIENGKGASKPFYTPAGRPLKSLSDTLKGKKGRFRYNLLGKRVDFSGRSVIVVSPQLRIQECGLPKEIALELYHYFLLRQILLKKQASSIVIAKKLIKERKTSIWNMLREIIYHHPVLLNRAPTLHRLGIQAFQPKLIDGNAIWLHPLVCSAFNADFDGDQMGVHLPLSLQARAEAWDLLWSRNNLLSPATGQPVLVPSQDMVLGFYYMTQSFASLSTEAAKFSDAKSCLPLEHNSDSSAITALSTLDKVVPSNIQDSFDGRSKRVLNVRQLAFSKQFFFDRLQLLNAFQTGQITIHTPVWLALSFKETFEHDKNALLPLELRLNAFGNSTYIYSEYKRRKDESTSQLTCCIRTTAGKVLVNTFLS